MRDGEWRGVEEKNNVETKYYSGNLRLACTEWSTFAKNHC